MAISSRTARAACTGAALSLVVLSTLADASPITAPCRPTVVCAVKVEQLPAVLLSNGDYELVTTSRSTGESTTPLPSTGLAHVSVVEPTVVRLDGAAYQGSVSIDPGDCGDEAIHTIQAKPKPAHLEFQIAAVALSELAVSCVSGCTYKARPADDFPDLPLPDDAIELTVELQFKARGYRSQTVEFKLNPGDNPIRVVMREID